MPVEPTVGSIEALSLDDLERWASLQTAYGPATDIPDLLREIARVPAGDDIADTWSEFWNDLAHQGGLYSAAFAAVPHVVRALAAAPAQADFNHFDFPAHVEMYRQKHNVTVPGDLRASYFAALARLPWLVAAVADRDWDEGLLSAALSAIAAAKGYGAVVEATRELTPEVAEEFVEWFFTKRDEPSGS